MATNLLDTIKQNLQSTNQQAPQASELNQTSLIQGLQQAKSGKAVGPAAAPAISNIQEQVANNQALVASQQMAQAGQMAAQQIQQQQAEQQQQALQQAKRLDQQTVEMMDKFTQQQDALLNDYQKGIKQLDLNKDKSKMEQIGFNIRLGNQKYIDNLQQEGARSRLDNQLTFNEELAKTIFNEESDLFNSDLQFRGMINADGRQFADEMSNIDIDFALRMAEAENAAANQRAMWQGIGSLISGGIGAYGAQQQGAFNSDYQDYRAEGGEGSYQSWQKANS